MKMRMVSEDHFQEMEEEIKQLKADLDHSERENRILWKQVHAKNRRLSEVAGVEATLRHQAKVLLDSLTKNSAVNDALVRNLTAIQAGEKPANIIIHDLNVYLGGADDEA